jgi:ATP-dependent DNA ligase
VCARLLNGDRSVRLIYMIFDVLALDGRSTMSLTYVRRRELLETLTLPREVAVVSDRFDDGSAIWDVVVERGLDGVVAKRIDSRYLPGDRGGGWVKRKNRETWWRYELEREGMERSARRRWRERAAPGVCAHAVAHNTAARR